MGAEALLPSRAKSSWAAGVLKVMASEGLSLTPVLANFFEALVLTGNDEVKAHASCFLKLARIVELLRRSSRGTVAPQVLATAIEEHLAAYKDLYGESSMIIKFHYCLHLPQQLAEKGLLLNCFVHERKHKMPKKFGNEVRNTSYDWDASVMREVTAGRLARMDHHEVGCYETALIDAHRPSKTLVTKLESVLQLGGDVTFSTATVARLNAYEKAAKGDVVMYSTDDGRRVGRVEFHASLHSRHDGAIVYVLTGIKRWDIVTESSRSWKCSVSDEMLLVETCSITSTLIWAGRSNRIRTVLKPTHV